MIRVSGSGAVALCEPLLRFPRRRRLSSLAPNETRFARFLDHGEVLDEVMVTVYHPPHSYTGEEMLEITCHGSTYIQRRMLELLTARGIRPARPGEFTERAFLNGRMDLARAEAVADVIAAESAAAHRLAMAQLSGRLSLRIRDLRTQLLHFASLIELELDFGEEDVEFADRDELARLAGDLSATLHRLADTFREGKLLKDGIPVAIAGPPNTGKSTLLNALLQEERAIVSEIPGTTRDFIEDRVTLDGYLFRFVDTAGLREHTSDTIERIGIERSYQKIREAAIILLLNEGNDDLETIRTRTREVAKMLDKEHQHLVVVINKWDIVPAEKRQELEKGLSREDVPVLFISALKEENLDRLKETLKEQAGLQSLGEGELLITNLRHQQALLQAAEDIDRVVAGLHVGLSSDLVALDLRQAIHHLGEITGEITTDEILGNIFKNFCIGK